MGKLLKLALVGRPNVGKSALFNQICKKRIAIVDEAEGVTRDRLYARADYLGRPFEVIDTGGIHLRSKAAFNEEIRSQALVAIEEADTIVLVVDATIGITTLDEEVAKILHKTDKPVTVAVNKVDDFSLQSLMNPFRSLGFKKMVPVSASHGFHIFELLQEAFSGMNLEEDSSEDSGIKVAIVGRPNVGKSTLLNSFLKEERSIVSPIAGTTRDSIDAILEYNDQKFTLIDTAGIRRKKSEDDVVEKFAHIRSERAIERSDVCLLMIEAASGITTQEKRIANAIEEAGKGCIVLVNKWDLVKGFRMEHSLQALRQEVPFLEHCPVIFISAMQGRNLEKIIPEVIKVHEASCQRVTTGQLNKFIEAAMQKTHPPMLMGKRLRVYFMTQVSTQPPQFVVFVNNVTLMTDTYKKYLINQFRDTFSFPGVPLEIRLRGKPKMTKEERLQDKKLAASKPLATAKDEEEDAPRYEKEFFEEETLDDSYFN